jgi:hypothetical protein
MLSFSHSLKELDSAAQLDKDSFRLFVAQICFRRGVMLFGSYACILVASITESNTDQNSERLHEWLVD